MIKQLIQCEDGRWVNSQYVVCFEAQGETVRVHVVGGGYYTIMSPMSDVLTWLGEDA